MKNNRALANKNLLSSEIQSEVNRAVAKAMRKEKRGRETAIDGTPIDRPFNLKGRPNRSYSIVRKTTLINSFAQNRTGAFVTNANQCYISSDGSAVPQTTQVSLAFRLDDLPDYTELTSLFDQYCITAVQIRVTPRMSNAVISGGASNYGANEIFIATDSSDLVVPTSLAALKEYQNLTEFSTTTQTNRKWIVKASPRTAVGAYAGSFSGYLSPGLAWADAQSPNIQHYGMKIGLPPSNSGGTAVIYDLDFTYHIALREVQ